MKTAVVESLQCIDFFCVSGVSSLLKPGQKKTRHNSIASDCTSSWWLPRRWHTPRIFECPMRVTCKPLSDSRFLIQTWGPQRVGKIGQQPWQTEFNKQCNIQGSSIFTRMRMIVYGDDDDDSYYYDDDEASPTKFSTLGSMGFVSKWQSPAAGGRWSNLGAGGSDMFSGAQMSDWDQPIHLSSLHIIDTWTQYLQESFASKSHWCVIFQKKGTYHLKKKLQESCAKICDWSLFSSIYLEHIS